MSFLNRIVDDIVMHRGGRVRVLGVPEPVTLWVDADTHQEAIQNGYIEDDGVVTAKFRSEYGNMFDVVGKIIQ